MDKMKIDQGEWVIVCDGAKALILENVGDSKFPNLQTKEVHEQRSKDTHEIGTDAPGRTFQSVGSKRSAMEQTDYHDLAERDFLEQLCGRLDRAVTAKETTSIVLIAAPRALGMIRQAYSNGLKHAIREELGKDYVHKPVHEIEKLLTG